MYHPGNTVRLLIYPAKSARIAFGELVISRIPVEGKFGNVKRKGTLARVMAKLAHTAGCVIHIGFIVLNLHRKNGNTVSQ